MTGELLKDGQAFQTRGGPAGTVVSLLGAGGQGEVYRVRWNDADHALKWYFPQSATPPQLAAIESLVEEGSPGDGFLWPLDVAEVAGAAGFGYVMPIRDGRFRGLTDFLAGRVEPTSEAIITAGLNLAKAFRNLHVRGLCYRDISFGNAFLDPVTGDVLVCDNDNVVTNRSAVGGVLGTPDFMAPEIVRGQAVPDRNTDNHSLAVLLFYLFHLGHPLVGRRVLAVRCWDAAARAEMFGKHPLFIFDPADHANEAVPLSEDPTGETGGMALAYWGMYPGFFRDVFTAAFTVGLAAPDDRVGGLQWLAALAALRDARFSCGCGASNYYDAEAMRATGKPASCWSCGKEPRLPFRVRLGKSVVMLNDHARLYPHHMADGRDHDFSAPVAEVVRHPTDPSVWGLRNLTARKWVMTNPAGVVSDVEPGKSARLATDVKVDFGRVTGEVRY